MSGHLAEWGVLLGTHKPLFSLALTLGAYAAGFALYQRSGRHPLLNPTLLGIAAVAAVLLTLHIDYASYFADAKLVHVLLGPAVVALAVPLYRHGAAIRERAGALGLALMVGSVCAVGSGVAVAWGLGASRETLLSLAPKSATTAVSMAISAEIGGIPALTAVVTILTGITGAVIAGYVLDALGIADRIARGFGMGLTSHGIATARAFQESETAGTFAGLAMGLNAVATAILVPILVRLLQS